MSSKEVPMTDHSADPSLELELDGNALAGTLEALFASDMTAIPGKCAHCGTTNEMGAMRAYTQGPGSVLRCPACDGVVLRLVVTDRATYVDVRGAAYLRFERR
jgi:hypothetical protein